MNEGVKALLIIMSILAAFLCAISWSLSIPEATSPSIEQLRRVCVVVVAYLLGFALFFGWVFVISEWVVNR